MWQQIQRGLAIADEIVVDEIDGASDAAFAQLVELGDDLLRRLQARIAAVKTGNVAEFALIRTAARVLDATEEVLLHLGHLVGWKRKLGHRQTVGRLQNDLLLRPRRVARQARNKIVGGVA